MTPEPHDPAALLSILWATPDHANRIAQLHGQLFAEPWTEATIRDLCKDDAVSVLIATDRKPDQIVGFIMTRIMADEGEVLSLGVAKPYQRFGVGKRLLDAVLRVMARAEVAKLYLEVAADNNAALALYKGRGFDQTGVRKGYYQRSGSTPCDALVLSRAPAE